MDGKSQMLSQHFKFFKMLGIQVFTPNITQHCVQTVPTCWMQHLQYPTLCSNGANMLYATFHPTCWPNIAQHPTSSNIVFKRCQHVASKICLKCWPNKPTSPNITQHAVQTGTTCWMQHVGPNMLAPFELSLTDVFR